jgi:predicted  nucleic acid-binding Zn-ribbon protein
LRCPEVSFTAEVNELQKSNASLSSELSQWKYQADLELEIKIQAEKTVNRMNIAVQEVQRDNEKLEHYIQEWKLIAKRLQGKIVRYYEEICKIFAILEELKSA